MCKGNKSTNNLSNEQRSKKHPFLLLFSLCNRKPNEKTHTHKLENGLIVKAHKNHGQNSIQWLRMNEQIIPAKIELFETKWNKLSKIGNKYIFRTVLIIVFGSNWFGRWPLFEQNLIFDSNNPHRKHFLTRSPFLVKRFGFFYVIFFTTILLHLWAKWKGLLCVCRTEWICRNLSSTMPHSMCTWHLMPNERMPL